MKKLKTIDKPLIGRSFDSEIFQFLEVACQCVQPFPDQRPTMLQVYKTLSAIGERYGLVDTFEAMMRHKTATVDISDECIDEEITELT